MNSFMNIPQIYMLTKPQYNRKIGVSYLDTDIFILQTGLVYTSFPIKQSCNIGNICFTQLGNINRLVHKRLGNVRAMFRTIFCSIFSGLNYKKMFATQFTNFLNFWTSIPTACFSKRSDIIYDATIGTKLFSSPCYFFSAILTFFHNIYYNSFCITCQMNN